MHICNPCTQRPEAGGLPWVYVCPGLHNEFKARLDCIAGPCLQKTKPTKQKVPSLIAQEIIQRISKWKRNSKGNHQQSEEPTYKMRKTFCSYPLDRGITFKLYAQVLITLQGEGVKKELEPLGFIPRRLPTQLCIWILSKLAFKTIYSINCTNSNCYRNGWLETNKKYHP